MPYRTLTSLLFVMLLPIHSHALEVIKADIAPVIDGLNNDPAWGNTDWHDIDQAIIGELPEKSDFSGRYKVVWTEQKLYILAEIVDDILADRHAHPLESYWNDDTFEILIDEDGSGGNHQFNYNALAYHIALDNQAVDVDLAGKPRLMNDHIQSTWKRSPTKSSKITWEVSVDVYPDTLKDTYADDEEPAKPVTLSKGKEMGFMIAYCDNDGGEERESFISSYDIPAVNGDKNRAYIDASVFQTIELVE